MNHTSTLSLSLSFTQKRSLCPLTCQLEPVPTLLWRRWSSQGFLLGSFALPFTISFVTCQKAGTHLLGSTLMCHAGGFNESMAALQSPFLSFGSVWFKAFQISASNCVKRQRSTTRPASSPSFAVRKPFMSSSVPSAHCFNRSWVSFHAVISCHVMRLCHSDLAIELYKQRCLSQQAN